MSSAIWTIGGPNILEMAILLRSIECCDSGWVIINRMESNWTYEWVLQHQQLHCWRRQLTALDTLHCFLATHYKLYSKTTSTQLSVKEDSWVDYDFNKRILYCIVVLLYSLQQNYVNSTIFFNNTDTRRVSAGPRAYAPTSALYFYPRDASAGLCDSDVSVHLSVRTSVCHTPVLCLAERKQDREMYTIW